MAPITNQQGRGILKHTSTEHYHGIRLWIDLFHALNNAKKLIYITGWSVFTEVVFASENFENDAIHPFQISLIRGEDVENCDDSNVGELLKRKAAEGVRWTNDGLCLTILFLRCVFWS